MTNTRKPMTQTLMPSRLVFLGTPAFALPVAEAVFALEPQIKLAAVVTAPDKPTGRKQEIVPPPMKVWAEQQSIPVLQPEQLNDSHFLASLARLNPSLGVIAAYGKIIPKNALDVFPKGVLNVHPSLLPRWRGPSPVQAAVLAGDRETGVTILLTDEEMDHGPILAQERLALRGDETAGELTKELFRHGATLLARTLLPWLSGRVAPQPQDHSRATFTKILYREDGRIDWQQPAETIARMVHAYNPWPGAFATLPDGSRLKILAASPIHDYTGPTGIVGEMREDVEGFPMVHTSDGWLRLERVQPDGKPPMSGNDFLRGHRELLGQRLNGGDKP